MSAQSGSQHTKAAHHSLTQEAALIANFYGKRGQLHTLVKKLVQGLDLSPLRPQAGYANEATQTFLRHFDPPAASAYDTTVVQLALNALDPVEPAWNGMRAQLATILSDDAILKDVWGYTLIYQAELAQDVPPAAVLKQLLPVTRRLHALAPEPEHPQLLAKTDLPGGWIGLVALPLEGDGLLAATVYLALSQPDSNDRLVQDVLYNPAAALLMADLVAHKGYYQVRQYRLVDLIDRYRRQMDALFKGARDILINLREVTAAPSELDELGKKYSALVVASADLHRLQVGLLHQVYNFTWWCRQAGEDEVVTYHQHFLEMASRELELLLAEGQHPLESAKMAVDMLGTSLDKEQERKQQRIETLLAAAAAVLSVLTLVDKETVRGLLGFLGVPQPIDILPVLGIQVGLIVLVALLAVLVIRLIRARHSRSHQI